MKLDTRAEREGRPGERSEAKRSEAGLDTKDVARSPLQLAFKQMADGAL